MINRLSLLLVFCLFTSFVTASDTKASSPHPADSIRVRWIDGKKFILHKVEPKETWSLLAKKYKCDIQVLKEANTGVVDLKVGQIINVPSVTTSEPEIKTGSKVNEKNSVTPESRETAKPVDKTPKSPGEDKKPVYYTVKQGETLYSISKRFEQSVDNIKAYNNLTNNAVKQGQKLIVSYTTVKSQKPVENEVSAQATKPIEKEINQDVKDVKSQNMADKAVPVNNSPAKTADKNSTLPVNNFEGATKTVSPIKKGNGGKTLMQVSETGVATWIQDGQLNQDKYYGLHRSAPIGTIIKVTNRMNNQFVYVKIVGVLPDTGENDNVIIKVSQAVKGKLNALDPLFQVELSYGIMQ